MLNVFKGFLFVVFIICDGMSGVSVGKSITISDCQDFFCKTEDDLKGVVSITFENQAIDDDFCKQWFRLKINNGMHTINFKSCTFLDYSFYIFDHLCVNNLALNNCDISAEDVDGILRINTDIISSIDLSNNNLGSNPTLFCENLKQYIGSDCNLNLILKDNSFTPDDQQMVQQLNQTLKFGF